MNNGELTLDTSFDLISGWQANHRSRMMIHLKSTAYVKSQTDSSNRYFLKLFQPEL